MGSDNIEKNEKQLTKVATTQNRMKTTAILVLFIGVINLCSGQSAEDYYKKGIQYAESKNFVEAILSYTLAISKNPYEWHYYQSRSYAYFVTKDNSNALKDINMALNLKPKYENVDCLSLRARILIEMRSYVEAIVDLTYIIDYFPEDFQTKYGLVHLDRGKAFLYSGQKDKACLDFNESLLRKMSDAQKFIDEFCH
jgi:tetratricopeptide (TPR) repeat protein